MSEKFIIKREWSDSLIKVVMDDNEVRIETSVEAFAQALEEKLLSCLPSLSWSFKAETINETVRKAFKEAWKKTTMEMKEETVKVAK